MRNDRAHGTGYPGHDIGDRGHTTWHNHGRSGNARRACAEDEFRWRGRDSGGGGRNRGGHVHDRRVGCTRRVGGRACCASTLTRPSVGVANGQIDVFLDRRFLGGLRLGGVGLGWLRPGGIDLSIVNGTVGRHRRIPKQRG